MNESLLIKKLQLNLSWENFIDVMKSEGFISQSSIEISKIHQNKDYHRLFYSGYLMLIEDRIQSATVRDTSHLHISSYIIFRPHTELQLQKIVVHSQYYRIPLTFASGKTGLSGGYANFGIIVDLANLHSFKKPFTIRFDNEQITAEQGVLISDLIKFVEYKSNGKYIFPIQPASALKLPVRVGGLISSNASGVTSGKLGAVEKWLLNIRIMKPNGEIIEIDKKSSLFNKIIGGNGFFGVILSGTFKLYEPLTNLKSAILFGYDVNSAFQGLQSVLNCRIFPLISEFVISPERLPGKFDELKSSTNVQFKTKWAAIIKGTSSEIEDFIKIMRVNANCSWKSLTEQEFQEYLQERSSFALIVQTIEDLRDYIAFPGFEDILSEPKNLPQIIETINQLLVSHGFQKVIFGYGHINFRYGQGLLLHMRLPVPIYFFYKKNIESLTKVCETVYDVIITLRKIFNIKHKAEHSSGAFKIWLDSSFRKKLRTEIKAGTAFVNPHLMIIDELIQEQFENKKDIPHNLNIFEKELSDYNKKVLFVSAMRLYLISN